ncbi:mannonate dehydratase [Granulosicoccus sp. 3-233]|uniref:mannonate dehydratase n=1 Tax=Granulosicoccus sp. 3-233 TaxID=3417969 RepID=UPI003D346815
MKHTWRWFGPNDLVSIDDICQAGATGIVSALHHIDNGEIWSREEIAKRQQSIATRKDGTPSGLDWDVVESVPVSEDIKKQDGQWRTHIDNYKFTLDNLAAAGIQTVCYNFMPILDWTRTDLRWQRPHGGTCMRFDLTDFALFDIHLLEREGAAADFPEAVQEEAARRYRGMTDEQQLHLQSSIVCGLPGANQELTIEDVKALLAQYDAIDADRLRRHHHEFLEMVAPHAEELGMRLCCHPDDPPYSLLGLPRVVSTEADYQAMLDAVDVHANGVTLCSGSLGARADNDLPGMMRRLGSRVHFLHLRNVTRDTDDLPCSFFEDEHLAGSTDMVALIAAALDEEQRRRDAGQSDWQIPMRPDHGQDILDDLGRRTQPGYPSIGRLKGLAELRGVELALSHVQVQRKTA